jgi:hypothetical protein
MYSPTPDGWSAGRSPIAARKPARAVIRGETASTSRLTTVPLLSRTPTRRSSTISRDATSPSTTLMPRAASCSASSSVGGGMVCEKNVTSALHCRNSNAWCTASGPLASTPMA